MSTRYVKNTGVEQAYHKVVSTLAKLGVSLPGGRLLSVRGRRSGQPRTTPVNLLLHEGRHYLVAPRGNTEWVRNLRVAGECELRLGRRTDSYRATELADQDKPPVLRAYLKRWQGQVGKFFNGATATSSDADLLAVAADYPVFQLTN